MDDGAGGEGVARWGLSARKGHKFVYSSRASSTEDLSQLQQRLRFGADSSPSPELPTGLTSQHSVSGVTGEALQKELMERVRQDRRKRAIAPARDRDNASHFAGAIIWVSMLLLLFHMFSQQFSVGGDSDSDGGGGGGGVIDEDWAT